MKQRDKNWNLEITNKTNLTAFISSFFNVKCPELDIDEITHIGKSYHIDSITRFEEKRDLNRLGQVKKYKAQFLVDSVLSIALENMNIVITANEMPLDSYGTVYPNLRITDNWGILEVDSCGALVSSDWKYVTISYPEIITDTLIRGKGWKLKLNEYWKLEKVNRKYKITKY